MPKRVGNKEILRLRETVKIIYGDHVGCRKNLIIMAAAYIEPRPLGASAPEKHTHYVVIVNGNQVGGNFHTQKAAKDYACARGYDPVHVARVRHFPDRDQPDHWRKDPC